MNPNAAWQIVCNDDVEPDGRSWAAAWLLDWLDRGGLPPETDMDTPTLIEELEHAEAYGYRP